MQHTHRERERDSKQGTSVLMRLNETSLYRTDLQMKEQHQQQQTANKMKKNKKHDSVQMNQTKQLLQ